MKLPEDPGDFDPTAAGEYWINKRTIDHTENTIRSNRKDLEPFLGWCIEHEIERVGDLSEWTIEQYENYAHAREDWGGVTVKNKLQTLKQFLEFLGEKGAFDGYLHPAVTVPDLDRSQEVNTEKWDKTDALPQIRFMRDSPKWNGTFEHVVTEVAWFTGRRVQALSGLDLSDYTREPDADDPADGPFLDFKHRADEGTRLKNKLDSEDPVEISEDVADVLDHYIARDRNEKRDENGRKPLFTTRQGRASIAKIRGAIYIATQPCIRIACPHGENAEKCKYRKRDHASKCPSSRSPHRIRTGSIQWQLDQGISPDDVSDRVDASVETIRRHYDVPDDREKMENRRRKYTGVLEDSINDVEDSTDLSQSVEDHCEGTQSTPDSDESSDTNEDDSTVSPTK
ncbi:tyrosine-type recombinase/integrase [Halorussus marinus]|uniref:tyrosine-type recombinase/integrase n=1 Tax=Halorussus marinus TaxID=2505976 RepID=UPI00106E14C2|nr:site-specific integrase [Halorussus marinus]